MNRERRRRAFDECRRDWRHELAAADSRLLVHARYAAAVIRLAATLSVDWVFGALTRRRMDAIAVAEFVREAGSHVPWRVAIPFGVLFGCAFINEGFAELSVPPRPEPGASALFGLALCCATGFIGARLDRDYARGVWAAVAAIFIAFFVAMFAGPIVVAGAAALGWIHPVRPLPGPADAAPPLPVMLALGVPLGGAGAGIGAWINRRSALTDSR